MPKPKEDSRDIYDKVADYLAPVAGAAIGGVAGRRLLGKTPSRKLKVRDTETGIEYSMETGRKSDFARGVISDKSPLARSTRGRKPGDLVRIKTPAGHREYQVLQNTGGSGIARNSAAYVAGGSAGAVAGNEAATEMRKRRK